MRNPLLFAAAFALLTFSGARAARADVAPRNLSECEGLAENADCKDDDGKAGACTKSTCSENDYSHGIPPTTKQYDCLLCQAKTTPATPADTSHEASSITGVRGSNAPSSSGGGCSVGGDPASSASLATGALGLLALIPLMVARRRRAHAR